MNTANFHTTVNRAGETGHYPISIETLDFLQEQIKLVANLASLVGADTIFKSPTKDEYGVAVYLGEVVSIAPVKTKLLVSERYRLEVESVVQDIKTADDIYKGARTLRVANVVQDANGWLKVNDRGELSVTYHNISTIKSIYNDLSRLQDLNTVSVHGRHAPVFRELEEDDKYGLFHGVSIIQRPEELSGYKPGASVFYDNGREKELTGAVLRTHLIQARQISERFFDPLPGLFQEITTRDGVVYERYVAPPNLKDDPTQARKDTPWHAKPGSIIGTMTLIPGQGWSRTGIFRYGRTIGSDGDITIGEDGHKLLTRTGCFLQVSGSPDNVASGRKIEVTWTMSSSINPGLRIRVSGLNDSSASFVSIVAFAMPATY